MLTLMTSCCIDKTSSAELSEAINSMFRWYQKAEICYVYLNDVERNASSSPTAVQESVRDLLSRSEWFQRGWTLQELLGPANLDFYTKNWIKLGSKLELSDIISDITGIEKEFLTGEDLERASASKKMSWAAGRKTSRPEDTAYCLLGIFGVYMPLIYGESKNAFIRLQHEIMKMVPHDHTLFAWGEIVPESTMLLTDIDELWHSKTRPWSQEAAEKRLYGLLAESPDDFKHSSSFTVHPDARRHYAIRGDLQPRQSYRGVDLVLKLLPAGPSPEAYMQSVHYHKQLQLTQYRVCNLFFLCCQPRPNEASLIILPLQYWGSSSYGRTRELLKMPFSRPYLEQAPGTFHSLCIEPERRENLQNGDFIFRRLQYDRTFWLLAYSAVPTAEYIEYENIWRMSDVNTTGRIFSFEFRSDISPIWREGDLNGRFRIAFGRNEDNQVLVEIVPAVNGTRLDQVVYKGLVWYGDPNDSFLKEPFLSNAVDGKVMRNPVDEWVIKSHIFPRITVKVEKVALANNKGYVDVVDLVILPSNLALRRSRLVDMATQTDLPIPDWRGSLSTSMSHTPRTSK